MSSKTSFSKNVLKHKEDTLVLQEIYILESEFSEDDYVIGNLIDQGFTLYDGKWLEHKKKVNRRMFTFRTGFYVDNAIKGEKLSIYLPLTGLPRNVYLNGISIYTAGRYKTDYNTSAYTAANIYLPKEILVYGDALNVLAIQGYPEHDQLALGAITISSYYTNAGRVFLQNFVGETLISSGVILSLIIFIYFLFLFSTMGFNNFTYLYFGLTCLFFGLSYVNLSFNNDGLPQILFEKISRCSFPWTVMFVTFFIMEFTNRFNKKRLIKIGISIPIIIITIVTAVQEKIAGVASTFVITMFGIMLPLLVFSIVVLFVSLIKDKNKKTVIILFSFAAVIITATYDIVHVVASIFPYVYLMQFGFISIVISIFFLLAYDQSQIFIASVRTAKDLNIKNESLKIMVDKIFSVSESLSTSSIKLEDIVETSSGVINQYEKDNNEIIDTVLKRLDDVEVMMIKIEERMDISTEKIPQAIINQTSIVEEVSATITSMNTHMERTMHSSNESNVAAQQLAGVAEKSRDMISESKTAITKISEYSQFLNDVLVAIENISDKTNILSINA
ncbi:MAG: hypothetical protein JXJ04_15375, partial [Spirochaetales bacterium]|nr:hypothetical protein [Spirochaetales bacterium]